MGHAPYPGCSPYSQARSWSAICALWMLSLCQASKSRSDGHWQWAGFATWVIQWRVGWVEKSYPPRTRGGRLAEEKKQLPPRPAPRGLLVPGAPPPHDGIGSTLRALLPPP